MVYTDRGLDSSHIREKREGEEEAAAPSLTDHLFSGQQSGAWGRGEGNQAVEAERKAGRNRARLEESGRWRNSASQKEQVPVADHKNRHRRMSGD